MKLFFRVPLMPSWHNENIFTHPASCDGLQFGKWVITF